MDRAKYELLCPLIVADRLAEVRREALADLAPPGPSIGEGLALLLGALLIRLGIRLNAIGRRHEMLATSFAPQRWPVVAAGNVPNKPSGARPNL